MLLIPPETVFTLLRPAQSTYTLTVYPDTPPGRYRLIAGVYLAPTGPRLPVEGNIAAGDHVVIEEIQVTQSR